MAKRPIKELFFDVETTGVDAEPCKAKGCDYPGNGLTQLAMILRLDGQEVERHNLKMQPIKGKHISREALEITGYYVPPEKPTDEELKQAREEAGEAFNPRELYHQVQLVKERDAMQEARNKLLALPDPREVYLQVTAMMQKYVDRYDPQDKFFLIGFNSHFDVEFFKQWFFDHGNQYFFSYAWYPDICVLRMIQNWFVQSKTPRPSFIDPATGKKKYTMKLGQAAEYFGVAKQDDERWHDAMFDVEVTAKLYDIMNQKTKELHHGQ